MTKRSVVILIFAFSLCFVVLSARSYRVSMVPHGSKWSCNTCHTAGGGTPRNSFGSAVGAITGPGETPFWSPSLAAADSDGDGFSNGVELQDSAGTWSSGSADPGSASLATHPGDATDYPAGSAIWEVPASFSLQQNYPNPFNPYTTISYDLPVDADVLIEVHNLLGEKVATLVNEFASAGSYYTIWSGQYDNGALAGSGVYFYSITAGEFSEVKRMLLLK